MKRSAVLFSGGLDSAVLVALELADGFDVWPVHVRAGLAWEDAEGAAIQRLTSSLPFTNSLRPVTTIGLDMRDVYAGSHWALTGEVPGYDAPDEDVYLAGRNIVLTAKTAVFAAERGIERIALGPLAGNPFPDATPEFFVAMSRALATGLNCSLTLATPLAQLRKVDVIRRGAALGVPLHLTMSCLRPAGGHHCGACNKCRERREAFVEAGVVDGTSYAAGNGSS